MFLMKNLNRLLISNEKFKRKLISNEKTFSGRTNATKSRNSVVIKGIPDRNALNILIFPQFRGESV